MPASDVNRLPDVMPYVRAAAEQLSAHLAAHPADTDRLDEFGRLLLARGGQKSRIVLAERDAAKERRAVRRAAARSPRLMSPQTTPEWPQDLIFTPPDIGCIRRWLLHRPTFDPNPWTRKLAAIYRARLDAFKQAHPNL